MTNQELVKAAKKLEKLEAQLKELTKAKEQLVEAFRAGLTN